ncbi:hypothetical protein IG193_00615 [Infirmifilum lucidum]|uniref:PIN domain-containing protein n=1 Tax=Infirmifilum lucidum TaxID=2776706 RepID=A0A7L9FIZ7_9CREN|nr:hypothetical protein [Infirmifilum lucidum]QOJ79003.1 hypothetical protein IG193_00615 [Infirmifilum lucidum]
MTTSPPSALSQATWTRSSSWRSRGTKTSAYLDTDIYVCVALRNRTYYEKCRAILYDAYSERVRAYGSPIVAAELLGSLSRVDAKLAREAMKAYLAMPVVNLEVTSETLLLASLVNTVTNIGYDAIHASLLLLNA